MGREPAGCASTAQPIRKTVGIRNGLAKRGDRPACFSYALVDALGNPIGFFLTSGEAHDLVGADRLLPTMEADMLIADKAFDADARVLEPLTAAGKTAVIPPRANRSSPRDYDRELYAARHLIENFFAKIKQFRAIATRYEKTARNFLAAVQLVASIVWLN